MKKYTCKHPLTKGDIKYCPFGSPVTNIKICVKNQCEWIQLNGEYLEI